MNTYTAVFAIPEIVIILIGVACIVWVVRTAREHKQAAANAALGQAWREVLNDPHYMERRHFEERKRVEDDEHKRAAAAIR